MRLRAAHRNDEAITCCRYCVVCLPDDQEPLCCSMEAETEVYRFNWHSSFGADRSAGRPDHAASEVSHIRFYNRRRLARYSAADVRLAPVAGCAYTRIVLGARRAGCLLRARWRSLDNRRAAQRISASCTDGRQTIRRSRTWAASSSISPASRK